MATAKRSLEVSPSGGSHPSTPAADPNGFTLVTKRRKTKVSSNSAHSSTSKNSSSTSLNISISSSPKNSFNKFRVSPNENYETSYKAVIALEQAQPQAKFTCRPNLEGFFVLTPSNEDTVEILRSCATTFNILELKKEEKLTKCVLQRYPFQLPLSHINNHPLTHSAVRCTITRDGRKTETMQVLITLTGQMPDTLDLGIWGTFKLRQYNSEPLRCFRCQRFGHHKNTCKAEEKCGICSGKHGTQICLDKYKAKEETTAKCPNCQGNHHVWNLRCPERLKRMPGRQRSISRPRITQLQSIRNKTPPPPAVNAWQIRARAEATRPRSQTRPRTPAQPPKPQRVVRKPRRSTPKAAATKAVPKTPIQSTLTPKSKQETLSLTRKELRRLLIAAISEALQIAGVKRVNKAAYNKMHDLADFAASQLGRRPVSESSAVFHTPKQDTSELSNGWLFDSSLDEDNSPGEHTGAIKKNGRKN